MVFRNVLRYGVNNRYACIQVYCEQKNPNTSAIHLLGHQKIICDYILEDGVVR